MIVRRELTLAWTGAVKVWTKKRQINNPYRGTLSSYGYVLLVIHFLTHVKSPAVLPCAQFSVLPINYLAAPLTPCPATRNLQRLPLAREYRLDELSVEGTDIYFFDDLDALPRFWQTSNHESVGELLVEFFRYFAQGFQYANHVIAIRSETGFINKEVKGWFTDVSPFWPSWVGERLWKLTRRARQTEYDPEVIVRDLHKLCIEVRRPAYLWPSVVLTRMVLQDPFQQDYNVARTVTRDGLYTVRAFPTNRIATTANLSACVRFAASSSARAGS